MGKTLTIAIPAYNAGAYLEKCLCSMLQGLFLKELEIIVVNDGSTDNTLCIAREYERKYPQTVVVIDQENGGHGAGVNVSARQAQGKYYKVIDADDWVLTENMPAFLEALRGTQADVVLTHFHTVHMLDGTVRPFQTTGIALNQEYAFEEFWQAGKGVRPCCCFHGICYRTDFYRACNFALPEKTFYEDQEYATVPFASVKTILPLDLFLYQYMIGNAAQSVSDENQVKRIGQIGQVLWDTHTQYTANAQMDAHAKQYFYYKMGEMLLSYFTTALIKDHDRKRGRANARRMRMETRAKDMKLYKESTFQYVVCRMLSILAIRGDTLESWKNRTWYRRMRRMMHR